MAGKLTVIAALVGLAACRASKEPEQAAAIAAAVPDSPNTAAAMGSAGGQPLPSLTPTPTPTQMSTAITDGRLPTVFVGRWGLVPADCTSTRGDNKGLMTVTPDRLAFYESRATITRLEGVSPTELRATLAFTGEGQEWREETGLVLEDGGRVLVRVVDGERLRYTRCDA
ncbi:hypothetical protein [Sphingomonas sp. IC4-52]|uniref:hypothetical protein n=1 Tax=Sphingomonas sp. IC4-52 TaxID=2887202 RepID=UPI001D0F9918|nr:hypothetical protein [Sphingomonas sp. IC4-52]MCC2979236.1 hypothetical protein [Sphingomonas sp. IC4-52]